jgi:molecular chaperone DnaJ
MAKSYFAILGILADATADEVRSAYRRLAKEFHPDHYAGGSERFQDIQEAYSMLGNSRRRSEAEFPIYSQYFQFAYPHLI